MQKWIFTTIIIVVITSGLIFYASATKGSYPGANGKIAFVAPDSEEPNDYEIFIMNEDGSGIQQLTYNSEFDSYPCWSPDGTKIVFSHQSQGDIVEIWVMNADGTGQKQITTPPADVFHEWPCWSPDGEKISFSRLNWEPLRYDIFVIDADTTGTGTLLIQSASSHSWSPDGNLIVFRDYLERGTDLWLADSKTGTVIGNTLGDGYFPCWSPDGSKIVFEHKEHIWIMNADGSNRIQLTFEGIPDWQDEHPNWSPDGTRIVFDREPDSIWVMNADGSGPFDLTPTMPEAERPDYQRIILAPVGGLTSPINKLEILTPYIALAGLIIAVSTVCVIKKRKNSYLS